MKSFGDRIMPYFFKNKDWYYFDEEKKEYFLTDKAPPEAIESYKEYLKEKEEEGEFLKTFD